MAVVTFQVRMDIIQLVFPFRSPVLDTDIQSCQYGRDIRNALRRIKLLFVNCFDDFTRIGEQFTISHFSNVPSFVHICVVLVVPGKVYPFVPVGGYFVTLPQL